MEYQSGAVSPVESIQEGWQLIKDDYWTFFGMTIVAGIIILIAGMIVGAINNGITFAIATAMGAATQGAGDAGRMTAAILPQIIGMFIGIFTNLIVITPAGALYCGIYAALGRKSRGEAVDFGELFGGFQKLQACFIVALIVSVIQFVIAVITLVVSAAAGISALGAGILTKNGKFDPSIMSGLIGAILIVALLSIVVNLIYGALTTFIYPLIGERNLSGAEAFMMSVKSGLSNLGGLILLLILIGLMILGGLIACLVGALFVAPIAVASIFAAYRRVWGIASDSYQYTPPAPPTFGSQSGY